MKKYISPIISIALVAAVLYVLGNEFSKNWPEISSFTFHFNIKLLIASSLLYAGALTIFALGWHMLMKFFHCEMSFWETLLFFLVTQPAKYVPGKIWLPVARMKLCGRRSIPRSITFLTTVIEAALEIIAGAYISIFTLLASDLNSRATLVGIVVISVLGLLSLIPRFFYFFINLYLRLLKRPHMPTQLFASFPKLLSLQLVYCAGILALGLSHALFLQSFAPVAARHFPLLIGIGAFSYVVGILAFFTPSGLGIREGIWYFALKTVTTNSVALIFSVVSRLWNIVVEAILAFIAIPFVLRRPRQ